MKNGSVIFKILCLCVATVLCVSAVTVLAAEMDEATLTDDVATNEVVTDVQEEVEDVTGEVETDVLDEAVDSVEPETGAVEEEEEEVLDLFAATLRDGGVYVTPGEYNAAVFDYEGLRYRVAAGTGNAVRLDGFESHPVIESEPIAANVKNRLQANGEITTTAAHSGYFGLSVYSGDVVYRTAVTADDVYVFSAWIKLPSNATISDAGRAFKVIAENGAEYVVGWNEIGRDVDATDSWQQVLFTFRAPATGLFEMDFAYKGKEAMSLDDIELYEAEVFDNPLEIKQVVCIDALGNEYTHSTGFETSGTLTHTTTLYNSDEDDVVFTAVMVLFKNDIMIDFEAQTDSALVLDDTEVTFEIEIPEDEDLSQYKYMVYFINNDAPTQYYGEMPSKTNPYIVKGK